MKPCLGFNPIEWIGMFMLVTGFVLCEVKSSHPPTGLPLIEFGIFAHLVGGLCGAFSKRKK